MAKVLTSFSQNVRYLTRSLEPRLLAADLGGQPRSKVTTCLFSTGRVDRTNTGYPRPRLSPQEVCMLDPNAEYFSISVFQVRSLFVLQDIICLFY